MRLQGILEDIKESEGIAAATDNTLFPVYMSQHETISLSVSHSRLLF